MNSEYLNSSLTCILAVQILTWTVSTPLILTLILSLSSITYLLLPDFMTPHEIEMKKGWEGTAHKLRLHHLSAQLLSLEIWLYDNSDFLYTSELQPSARLLPTHLSDGEGPHASLGFIFDTKIWEKSNILMTEAWIMEPILNFPLHHLQDSWKKTFVNDAP